jgi:hypothetical protein
MPVAIENPSITARWHYTNMTIVNTHASFLRSAIDWPDCIDPNLSALAVIWAVRFGIL